MDLDWSFSSVQLVANVSIGIGFPPNLLLIWLILWRTEKLLRIWSMVLLQTAVLDLSVLLSYFLVQPVMITNASFTTAFCFLYGPIRWIIGNNQPLALALSYMQTGFQEFAKYSLAVQFVYRWLVICREWDISARRYALFLCVPAGAAFFLIAVMHYGWLQDGVGPPTVEDGVDVQHYSTAFAYALPMNSNYINIVNAMQSVFNSITFLVIIACNLMIWLSSRGKMQHQSQKKSRELRNQVGRVLIAQATLNLLLILLPALIAVLAMNIFKDVFTRWLQLLIFQTWSSTFAPFCTILIIGPYRRALVNMLPCKRSRIVANEGIKNSNISSTVHVRCIRQINVTR